MELEVDVYMKNSEGKIVDVYHETIDESDVRWYIENIRHPFNSNDRWEVDSITVTKVEL
jgi:hypothetical protein